MLEGAASPLVDVTSGVPQGSILGPLLFSLCVDPLLDVSVSNTSILSMYADDIVLHKPIFSSMDITSLQNDLDLVCMWVESVGLRLNVRKTESLLVSRKHQRPSLQLRVNGALIEQVSTFKYLGVWLSEDLS